MVEKNEPTVATFYGIHYSPWSEKAKWGLDAMGYPYRYREHVIMLGMPALSARTGLSGSEITLPLLLESGGDGGTNVVMDSFDIILHAHERLRATGRMEDDLIPEGSIPELRHLNLLCDTLLDGARARLIRQILQDPVAQEESLPGFIPGLLRKPLRFLARRGAEYVRDAFDTERRSDRELAMIQIQGLTGLQAEVEKSGGGFLREGRFTLFDLLAATCVHAIRPVSDEFMAIAPSHRAAIEDEIFVSRFGPLLEWRDRIYLQSRRPR